MIFWFALVSTIDYDEEDEVVVLYDADFDKAIKEFSEGLLVKFYAPWCGHCKKLAPEYSKAATKLRAQDPPIYLAHIDATEQTESAERYQIKGYPTLKFFIDGKQIDYNGDRTEKDIIEWVNKKIGPPVLEKEDKATFERHLEEQPLTLAYFGEKAHSNFKKFEEACKEITEFVCVAVEDASLLREHDVAKNSVVLFKNLDEGKNVYSGNWKTDDIRNFVKWCSVPAVSEFNAKLASLIFQDGNPALFLFRTNQDNTHEEILKNVAPELKQ